MIKLATRLKHTSEAMAAVVSECLTILIRMSGFRGPQPYYPEAHYMRGPGPKWRAKYGLADARIKNGLRVRI